MVGVTSIEVKESLDALAEWLRQAQTSTGAEYIYHTLSIYTAISSADGFVK
jgi:hypothetical protein